MASTVMARPTRKRHTMKNLRPTKAKSRPPMIVIVPKSHAYSSMNSSRALTL